jgi:hypothetical protein
VTAAPAGGHLLYASSVDRVVGDQQYDVPPAVDTERHRTVVIWCRAFSVAFGSARLA